MAHTRDRLSTKEIENYTAEKYYADGGNLYFRVAPNNVRGWIFRFVSPVHVYSEGQRIRTAENA